MKLTVYSSGQCRDIFFDKKTNLLRLLQDNGYEIKAGCGGNGTCKKCRVRVISGLGEKDSYILACQSIISCDGVIEVFEDKGTGLDYFNDTKIEFEKKAGYSIAMDLGTTTIAYNLVSLTSGKVIDKVTCLNPQASFGADVISRIKYATENNVSVLQDVVIHNIKINAEEFAGRNNIKNFECICVAGNTTMLNIFLGEDISGIGKAPYTARILESKRVPGENFGLARIKEVVTLPSQSAFVGGDAVIGSVVVEEDKGNNIFVDIGTNGEIIVTNNGRIFCGSTAAGPCFEGAKIECGMGGCAGAINHVAEENGKIVYTTIGDVPATGICGSGLIDTVAFMMDKKVIDITGAFENDEDRFYLTDKIYISARDIREFQLAKSAIRSGIEVLADMAGLSFEDADNLFVAGGFGFYINMENAVKTGLLPEALMGKIKIVGNTALKGAYISALSPEILKKASAVALKSETVELSDLAEFSEKFMNNILFGEF